MSPRKNRVPSELRLIMMTVKPASVAQNWRTISRAAAVQREWPQRMCTASPGWRCCSTASDSDIWVMSTPGRSPGLPVGPIGRALLGEGGRSFLGIVAREDLLGDLGFDAI